MQVNKRDVPNGVLTAEAIENIESKVEQNGLTTIMFNNMHIVNIPPIRGIKHILVTRCTGLVGIQESPDVELIALHGTSAKYIRGSPNLKCIDISSCNVERLPGAKFNIEILHIANSKTLKKLPKYCNLKELKLSGCLNLETIPIFKNLEKLTIEHCGENLTKIPSMPNLKYLKILDLKVENLPDFPKLTELLCYGGKLKKLPPVNNTLIKLECKHTLVEEIPDYPKLEDLDCSSCYSIEKIPYLKSIKKINTTYSSLDKIGIKTLADYKAWIERVDEEINKVYSVFPDGIDRMLTEFY